MKCKEILNENNNSIECYACKEWLHSVCGGLSNTQFHTILELGNKVEFFCVSCVLTKNQPKPDIKITNDYPQPQINVNTNVLDALKLNLQNLNEKINNLHQGGRTCGPQAASLVKRWPSTCQTGFCVAQCKDLQSRIRCAN